MTIDEKSTTKEMTDDSVGDANCSPKSPEVDESSTVHGTTSTEPVIYRFEEHPGLGHWVLVDSEMSTSLFQMTSAEMIVTRTGEDTFEAITSWKLRFCCLPCISIPGSNINVTKVTGEDTFTVRNKRTNLLDGNVEYGKIEGNNKFKTVGKKGTNEIEYRGDRCYMKIVDARYSLYIKQEYKKVG